MLDYLTTNMDWVLALRTPFLTPFFKIFPYFASDLVYLSIILVGYWIWDRRICLELGFLVCLCTLLNVFLKQICDIPRPSIEHLVNVMGTGGFPSGDTQVAIAFWMAVIIYLKRPFLWFFFAPFIALISISRIYLGVHSSLDVMGGLIIGVLYVKGHFALLRSPFWKKLQPHSLLSWFSILLFYFIFFQVVSPLQYPVSLCAGGALLGMIITSNLTKIFPLSHRLMSWPEKILMIVLGLASVVGLRYYLNTLKVAHLPLIPLIQFLSYTVLVFYGLYVWPKIVPYLVPLSSLRKDSGG